MLDGIASAVEGAVQSDSAVGVAGDLLAPAVRLVDNRAKFFNGQCGLRHEFSVLSHPGAVRHVDLNPVCAVVELLARRFARLNRTVDNLRTLRHLKLGSIAFEGIAA